MGRKGRERFEKRQREQQRREKAQAKAERKQASSEEGAEDDAPDEQALLESFRLLSEKHEAGDITDDELAERKREIFELLGIDAD